MEVATQPAEGLGVGVSVGVTSSVLEGLADEDVLESLSDEELEVVSRVLDWLTNEEEDVVGSTTEVTEAD